MFYFVKHPIGITDGIYGELPEENVKRVIAKFGPKASQKQEDIQTSGPDLPPEVIQLARLLMEQIKKQAN